MDHSLILAACLLFGLPTFAFIVVIVMTLLDDSDIKMRRRS